MTNHWIDLKNANVHLIMGSNAVENHPIASYWIWKAKEENDCKIIHVDPRFTRTSAKADMYAPIRSGTDIVFLGGMIRWMIEKWELSGYTKYINTKYAEDCTNALFKVAPGFKNARHADNPGNFSADTTWDYDYNPDNATPSPDVRCPKKALNLVAALSDSQTVFYQLKQQYSAYTPQMVQRICGTPAGLFEEICEEYCGGTYADDKAGTVLYAMGWTQHTVGTQNIRTATIVQSLLGNIGVAGGGVDALRGWHNVQGATDHGVLMHLLPGYNPLPQATAKYASLGTGPTEAPADLIDTYLKATIPLAMDPDSPTAPQSSNWWGMFAGQYNRARYVVSNLKAWWPGVPAATSYDYLPKRTGDCSFLTIMDEMGNVAKPIKGLFCWGTNPMVMGPDQTKERAAMKNLEWLVVCDCFETETSSFWKNPAEAPGSIATTVYFLPAAYAYEKAGSAANSGRLMQWRDKACAPPGEAKDEVDILNDLGTACKAAINAYSGATPQTDNLAWPVGPILAASVTDTLVEKVAKECNGYALLPFTTAPIAGATASYTAGQQINTFFHLRSTEETACGNWLFCGTWQTTGNQMRNRDPIDYHPYKIGIHHKWGYSWPVNRRIIYNRAAVYQSGANIGKPLNPNKPVVWWDTGYSNVQDTGTAESGTATTLTDNGKTWTVNQWAGKKVYISAGTGSGQERTIFSNTADTLTMAASGAWVTIPDATSQYTISVAKWNWNYNNLGNNPNTYPMDVVDGFGTSGPNVWLPFIMREEGVARLMAITTSYATPLKDGPFPEHWEPRETPLTSNPLTGGTSMVIGAATPLPLVSPFRYEYAGALLAAPGAAAYPYVCTTYRLTEHWHGGGFTRNSPTQYEAQPEPFVEMSEELADELGIPKDVDGKYTAPEVTVASARGSINLKACVTKRWKPYNIDGRLVHEVGIPWHWGWAGMAPGATANMLTPFIGDANTRIPETKVFLVNITYTP